jgi:hypothetical protein
MHGNARSVERKIRLWVIQQERNRRQEAQRGQVNARGSAPVEQRQRTINLRMREHWR